MTFILSKEKIFFSGTILDRATPAFKTVLKLINYERGDSVSLKESEARELLKVLHDWLDQLPQSGECAPTGSPDL